MKKNITTLKYKYLIADIIQNKSLESCLALIDMIEKKQIKITIAPDSGKLIFLPLSKYDSHCIKCNEMCRKGTSVFVRDGKAWHLDCASNEDLQNTYLKTCLKQGLIQFDLEEKIKKNEQHDIFVPVIKMSTIKGK